VRDENKTKQNKSTLLHYGLQADIGQWKPYILTAKATGPVAILLAATGKRKKERKKRKKKALHFFFIFPHSFKQM